MLALSMMPIMLQVASLLGVVDGQTVEAAPPQRIERVQAEQDKWPVLDCAITGKRGVC